MVHKLTLPTGYFSKLEWGLWGGSSGAILLSFLLFDRGNVPALLASLIGAASLIFCAKGNPLGQCLMIFFSLLYGFISYTFSYYGEMITYLGMTLPMAVLSLVSWLRHPYEGRRAEVQVNRISRRELPVLGLLSVGVTVGFYFILAAFDTANLAPSTLSVTTSFVAVYLTFRRSPFYALAYALNDMVLIVLWVLASLEDRSYVSVVVCFVVFLLNDSYGFLNWKRMESRQAEPSAAGER